MRDNCEPPSSSRKRPLGIGRTRPPRQRVATATRDTLLARLDRLRGAALTVVQSPAGFGKTVLLAQWFDKLKSGAARAAWLTLDENDREVTRFVADVGAALASTGLAIPPEGTVQARSSADVQHRRELICAAIEREDDAVVLFLDDYHRAASADTDRFVEQMIRADSGNLQLVLATRDPLQLRVAALEAQGLVHRIGPSDLALSLEDTRVLFGAALPAPVLAALHERTEGWAVALQLARLWLEGDPARHQALASFSARTDALARYLVEQVLADLGDDERTFLTETAILDTFDAATADAVRGTADADRILGRLSRFDALLVPLDPERRWFRYHHLFAEFLTAQLERQSPGRSVALHAAAADHFDAAGDIERSVTHACRAGDVARAVATIQRAGGWEIVLQRGIGFARGLLGQFEAAAVEREAALLRMQGYLQMKTGALGQARASINAAACLDASASGKRDGAIIDALLRTYADDLLDPGWSARVAAALSGLDEDDAIGRGTLHAATAVEAIGAGDFDRAGRHAAAGIHEMDKAGSVLGEAYCRFHHARAHVLTGRTEIAEAELRDVLSDVERRHGGDRALMAIGSGLLGATLLMRAEELAEARALLGFALSGIEAHDSWLDVLAATYEAGIRLARADCEADAVAALLDRAADVARERALDQLGALVAAWRIEHLVAIDRLEDAAALAAACPAYPGWRARAVAGLAVAQLAIRSGRTAEALRALRACREEAVTQGRLPDLIRIDLLLAAAYRARRQPDAMLAAARDMLDNPALEAAPGALRGLAVNAAPILTTILRHDDAAALSPIARAAARRLFAFIDVRAKPSRELSLREQAILAALCDGSSNKEIGRRLDLTENTVKFHLKNIYGKLGAHSRAAAVSAALSRGLVTG